MDIKTHNQDFLYSYSLVLLVFCILLPCWNGAHAADYLIGPGDVLKISVYDNDDLLTITRVSENGYVNMPLLGQIKVAQMTIPQASKRIAALLADGYLVNPQVNIFVQEFRSKKAIVLGQVNHPGIVEMSGPTTFLELISKAGGLTDDYGETATIKRNPHNENKVIPIDMKSLIEGGDLRQNYAIEDGDTVYIPKAGMCYVTGEVKAPNAYKCGNGISIIKLITLAGGFTGKASKSGVRIVRVVNGEKKIFKNVEMETPVQPNDVIIVPESFF